MKRDIGYAVERAKDSKILKINLPMKNPPSLRFSAIDKGCIQAPVVLHSGTRGTPVVRLQSQGMLKGPAE